MCYNKPITHPLDCCYALALLWWFGVAPFLCKLYGETPGAEDIFIDKTFSTFVNYLQTIFSASFKEC